MNNLKRVLRLNHFKERSMRVNRVNHLIFWLRRIPFFGKKIPSSIYRNYTFTRFLYYLDGIKSLFWIPLGGILTLFFPMFLASFHRFGFKDAFLAVTSISAQDLGIGYVIWLICIVIIFNLLVGRGSEVVQEDDDFIKQYQVSQSDTIKGKFCATLIKKILAYTVALGLFARFSDWRVIPIGLMSFIGVYFISYVVHRYLVLRNIVGMKRFFIILFLTLLIPITAFLLLTYRHQINIPGMLKVFLPISATLMILGILMMRRPVNEDRYFVSLMEEYGETNKALTTAKEKAELESGLSLTKKLKMDGQEKVSEHLTGGAYLNALLFRRYRRPLLKGLFIRLGFLLAVVVGLILLFKYHGRGQVVDDELFFGLMPIFFFYMAATSVGKTIVQLCFTNCDASMLYYPFYRESKTILSGFNFRFGRLLAYNGILGLAMFLGLILFDVFNPTTLKPFTYGILLLFLFAVVLLVSFHELFVYYLMQPFTGSFKMVNPAYHYVSSAVYLIAFISLQLRLSGLTFTIIMTILALSYVAVGYFLIQKKAPQTFRIKK